MTILEQQTHLSDKAKKPKKRGRLPAYQESYDPFTPMEWQPPQAPRVFVGFSGGADSTALALKLAELGAEFDLLTTPTGNELPEVSDHVARVAELTGRRVVYPKAPTLADTIAEWGALPNHRMRFCTRMIKITPCIAYMSAFPGAILCVGLRADEEDRPGLYDNIIIPRRPLADWGWVRRDVEAYCNYRGVRVPRRTDCAVCFHQTLGEWYELWRTNMEAWWQGEEWERQTGYTFRSPSRDTWPAAMRDLRACFELGYKPRGVDDDDAEPACRVCRF